MIVIDHLAEAVKYKEHLRYTHSTVSMIVVRSDKHWDPLILVDFYESKSFLAVLNSQQHTFGKQSFHIILT